MRRKVRGKAIQLAQHKVYQKQQGPQMRALVMHGKSKLQLDVDDSAANLREHVKRQFHNLLFGRNGPLDALARHFNDLFHFFTPLK
jgi:hypothetical protein